MSIGFSPAVKELVTGRANGMCEICGEKPGSEFHHRRARGMGGSSRGDTNTASNCLLLCVGAGCHRLVELNRTVARVMGWLVPQGWAPADAKVIYRGEVKWLHDDGEVTSEPTAFV